MNKKIIALIPARGGSKGIPKKNIKMFLDIPLIVHSIKYALSCEFISDIYVTTVKGDRLDNLAYQFYQDVRLWWIIANANRDIIRRDSFGLKPGLEIRIPSNITKILYDFELINKISY